MKNQNKIIRHDLFYLFALIVLMAAGPAIAQKKAADQIKLYEKIAGNYEFTMEGQVMIITFWVEEGKLIGAPEGEEPEELIPVEGKEMIFEVTPPNEQTMELEFKKDEEGKITICIISAMGMEIEGQRVKE